MQDNPKSAGTGLSNGENGGTYEFRIKGHLDDRWLDWFEGMILRYTREKQTGLDVTEITATMPDQPALHGFLNKIRDLNLTLLSVTKNSSRPAQNQGEDDDASQEPER
jgi:hypothetical protein